MKSVLVEISGTASQDGTIQAALDLVRASSGHLTCLQITPRAAYAGCEGYGGPGMLAALIASIDEQRREEQTRLEHVLAGEGVSWDWVHCDGEPLQALVSASRLADTIVVAQRHLRREKARSAGFVGALTLAARAPVIVVPPAIKGFAVAGSAIIAWNGSFEAAQALRAALPLLALAESVDIVTVGETDNGFPATAACAHLSRHGVHAEILVRSCDGGTAGQAILRTAAERGSAYLVMGAYGHSRLREYAFGGVTRSLLAEAPLPLLLAH